MHTSSQLSPFTPKYHPDRTVVVVDVISVVEVEEVCVIDVVLLVVVVVVQAVVVVVMVAGTQSQKRLISGWDAAHVDSQELPGKALLYAQCVSDAWNIGE